MPSDILAKLGPSFSTAPLRIAVLALLGLLVVLLVYAGRKAGSDGEAMDDPKTRSIFLKVGFPLALLLGGVFVFCGTQMIFAWTKEMSVFTGVVAGFGMLAGVGALRLARSFYRDLQRRQY